MLVTLLGISMAVNLQQHQKALFPMLVTLLGMVMEVKLVQPRKALLPMLVTLLGIVMEVRLDIPEHKYAGIDSTLSPNVNEVICSRRSKL